MRTTIKTASGRVVDLLNLRTDDVTIEDIAHALSRTCRYAGHYPAHLSVAEHSVMVSLRVSPERALWGLMHDAAETYLGDVLGPLKKLQMFDGYRMLEREMMFVITSKFGLDWPEPAEVHKADQAQGEDERQWRDGHRGKVSRWVKGWGADRAREEFLARFRVLTTELPDVEEDVGLCAVREVEHAAERSRNS